MPQWDTAPMSTKFFERHFVSPTQNTKFTPQLRGRHSGPTPQESLLDDRVISQFWQLSAQLVTVCVSSRDSLHNIRLKACRVSNYKLLERFKR